MRCAVRDRPLRPPAAVEGFPQTKQVTLRAGHSSPQLAPPEAHVRPVTPVHFIRPHRGCHSAPTCLANRAICLCTQWRGEAPASSFTPQQPLPRRSARAPPPARPSSLRTLPPASPPPHAPSLLPCPHTPVHQSTADLLLSDPFSSDPHEVGRPFAVAEPEAAQRDRRGQPTEAPAEPSATSRPGFTGPAKKVNECTVLTGTPPHC